MYSMIELGSSGDIVTSWQTFLRGRGHLLEVTGSFDESTATETKAFQKSHSLRPDGIVGNFTFGAAMLEGFEIFKTHSSDKEGPNWPPFPQPDLDPLPAASRYALFGAFDYVPAPTEYNPEGIRIVGSWARDNIVQVTVPQLLGVVGGPPKGSVAIHRKVAKQLVGVFQAWQDRGLIDKVITWAGSWAPRFVRGSRTTLSNHATGTAFDINAQWNPLGSSPALVGEKGCVRELVHIANEFGWFWGGHFRGRPDGMHFEIAKVLEL